MGERDGLGLTGRLSPDEQRLVADFTANPKRPDDPVFGVGKKVVYRVKHLKAIGILTKNGFPVKGSGGSEMAHARGEIVAQHPRIADWVSVRWDTDPKVERADEAPGWNGKDAIDFDDKPSEPHAPNDEVPFAPRWISKHALALDPLVHGPNLRATSEDR